MKPVEIENGKVRFKPNPAAQKVKEARQAHESDLALLAANPKPADLTAILARLLLRLAACTYPDLVDTEKSW
jgi:hypothetical protein